MPPVDDAPVFLPDLEIFLGGYWPDADTFLLQLVMVETLDRFFSFLFSH